MRVSRSISIALLLAAVAYLGLPLEVALDSPLDPTRSYLSENAALNQPHHAAFRVFDAAAAVMVLGGVTAIFRTSMPPLFRAAQWFLALFAVATLVDSAFPMRCAPSLDVRCSAEQAAGTLGLGHSVHSAASATAVGAVVLSSVFSAAAIARSTRRRPAAAAVLLAVAAALAVASAVMTIAALADAHPWGLPEGAGLVQRVQTLLISVYLGAYTWFIRWHESPRS